MQSLPSGEGIALRISLSFFFFFFLSFLDWKFLSNFAQPSGEDIAAFRLILLLLYWYGQKKIVSRENTAVSTMKHLPLSCAKAQSTYPSRKMRDLATCLKVCPSVISIIGFLILFQPWLSFAYFLFPVPSYRWVWQLRTLCGIITSSWSEHPPQCLLVSHQIFQTWIQNCGWATQL